MRLKKNNKNKTGADSVNRIFKIIRVITYLTIFCLNDKVLALYTLN